MATSHELKQQLNAKRAELDAIFKQAETQVLDERGIPMFDGNVMNADRIREVNDRNKELSTLEDDYQRLRLKEMQDKNASELESLNRTERKYSPGATAYNPRSAFVNVDGGQKSLSDMVRDSAAFKNAMGPSGNRRFAVELEGVDIKTLMTTAAGYAAPNPRTDRVVVSAQRRPVISDIIPTDTTENSVIKWMEETTFTNNASTVSEGATKPEAALAFTERTANVQKIAQWLPVTEEQLDDVNGLRNLIDNRLVLMLLLHEEHQLLYGNNAGANMNGFMQASGLQSQAFSTNNMDTILKAFTLVRYTGFAEPSAVILHPANWETIQLAKTTTNEYIWGAPEGVIDTRIWGKPVIVTPAMTSGRGLTGDFVLYSHISRKMGIRVDVSDSHSTFFIENKLAIRAEMRETLEIYRGAAFCKMESLT